MAAFTTARTARKPHRCSTCGGQIRPGQRYTEIVLTPGHDDAANEGWERLAYHLTAVECDYEFAAPSSAQEQAA